MQSLREKDCKARGGSVRESPEKPVSEVAHQQHFRVGLFEERQGG